MSKQDSVAEFQAERERLNEIVLRNAGQVTKRFYSLDHQAYKAGAMPARTKELLGLVASLVLRCDDCIKYHLVRCHEERVTREELDEAISIATMVGGTITIPHMRRAWATWEELEGGR
jgi:AhpD family alkylhydroperoxidase